MRPLACLAVLLAACGNDRTNVAEGRLVAPEALGFGGVLTGRRVERPVLLENRGTGPLEVVLLFVPAGEFSSDVGNLRLGPAESATLGVAFAPAAEGPRTSALELLVGGEVAASVALSGTGTARALAVEPTALDFGGVLVGSNETRTLAVTSLLGEAVEVVVTPSGDTTGAFALEGLGAAPWSVRLGPEGTAELAVVFTPGIGGAASATLSFAACPGCPAEDVALEGRGIGARLVAAPSPLDFGAVLPGERVVERLVVRNEGSRAVALTGGRLESEERDFHLVPPATWPALEAGGSLELAIAYEPSGLGPDATRLFVTTDDPATPSFEVELKGYGGGPVLSLRPEALAFGDVALGAVARRRLVVANAGLNDPSSERDVLEVTAVVASDPALGVVGLESPLRLAPGQVAALEITLEGSTAGALESDLVVSSNDRARPEATVPVTARVRSVAPCAWSVTPAALDFGLVPKGRPTRRAVAVRNEGTVECLVSAAVEGASPFVVSGGDVAGEVVAPGDWRWLELEVVPPASTPVGSELSAVLGVEVHSAVPRREVTLSARVADACLVVTPVGLHFGTVAPGCATAQRRITVHNACATNVGIARIAVEPAANPAVFAIVAPNPPFTLRPREERSIDVRFRPPAEGPWAAALHVTSNLASEAGRPHVVPLAGDARAGTRTEDTFVQADTPGTDILFVVDDSGSMGDEQRTLADEFEAFIDFAVTQQSDYRIGVTTTDTSPGGAAGRLVPLGPGERLVTPLLADPAATFRTNVRVGLGGSGIETGLEAAYLALGEPLASGHNAGLLRPHANLAIVIVSDEEDSSGRPVDFYANALRGLKGAGREHMVTVNAIVGADASGAPRSCNGPGGSASAGTRYAQVASRTGGVVASICRDDWSESLRDIGATAFGWRSRFVLSAVPDPSTLEVRVDGVPVPAGAYWSWNATDGSVDFLPTAVPPPSSTVRVSYVVGCAP